MHKLNYTITHKTTVYHTADIHEICWTAATVSQQESVGGGRGEEREGVAVILPLHLTGRANKNKQHIPAINCFIYLHLLQTAAQLFSVFVTTVLHTPSPTNPDELLIGVVLDMICWLNKGKATTNPAKLHIIV